MQQIDQKGLDALVLSAEQANSDLDHISGKDSRAIEKLPEVQSAAEPKRSNMGQQMIGPSQFNKLMEFMMMERLNFLRNSLDSHNPHETTIRMRDIAAKRCDELCLLTC